MQMFSILIIDNKEQNKGERQREIVMLKEWHWFNRRVHNDNQDTHTVNMKCTMAAEKITLYLCYD